MATIMEKDVLLEYVASEIAKSSINNKREIVKALARVREWLYSSDCCCIDYQGVIEKIENIVQEREPWI